MIVVSHNEVLVQSLEHEIEKIGVCIFGTFCDTGFEKSKIHQPNP